MDWSVILNVLFGTGLVATIVGLFSIRSELKKARAEAEKAMAEADTVKITNTENATRILIENIVEPLRRELDETRKELHATKREMSRFRKAVEAIPLCPYHGQCPVLGELRLDEGGSQGRSESPVIHGRADRHQSGVDQSGRPVGGGKPGADNPGRRHRKPAGGRGIQPTGGEYPRVGPPDEGRLPTDPCDEPQDTGA